MKIYTKGSWHYWYDPSLRLWVAEHVGLNRPVMYENSKSDIIDAIKKQGEL